MIGETISIYLLSNLKSIYLSSVFIYLSCVFRKAIFCNKSIYLSILCSFDNLLAPIGVGLYYLFS